jgi:hypothetical protein
MRGKVVQRGQGAGLALPLLQGRFNGGESEGGEVSFIDKLGVHYEKTDSNIRLYKAIDAGKFSVSIQGSEFHYCDPRKTVDPHDYTEMEVAIFEKEKWIDPHTDERLQAFPRLQELLNHYEQGSHPVGGYVPVDVIEALLDYLTVAK